MYYYHTMFCQWQIGLSVLKSEQNSDSFLQTFFLSYTHTHTQVHMHSHSHSHTHAKLSHLKEPQDWVGDGEESPVHTLRRSVAGYRIKSNEEEPKSTCKGIHVFLRPMSLCVCVCVCVCVCECVCTCMFVSMCK